MVITDLVYNKIYTEIAQHYPEKGGALFGPKGLPFVTHFEMDTDAETTAVSYIPSTKLINKVPKIELEIGLQFKGIIHSHPRGVIRPSGGDASTVSSFFRLNPHFSSMLLPIVQQAQNISDDFIHWYRAEKCAEQNTSTSGFEKLMGRSPSSVSIIQEDCFILPVAEHINIIIEKLAECNLILVMDEKPNFVKIKNADMLSITAKSTQRHEFIYFVSMDYPIIPPIVLYQLDGETKILEIGWIGLQDPLKAVDGVVQALLTKWRPSTNTENSLMSNTEV